MKRIVSAILAIAVVLTLTVTAFAATNEQQNIADALNSLGMFKGNEKGYDLDATLKRSDGITLLVRLLGKEKEASAGSYQHPFNDVADWLKPYVAYAYTNKIVNGVSKDRYGSKSPLTQVQFLTMVLRALGYSDTAKSPDFSWDKPFTLANKVGVISNTLTISNFKRADAIQVFWNAMGCKLKGSETTLSQKLIADGVFTKEAFEKASKIKQNGAAAENYTSTVKPVKDNAGKTLKWEEYQALSNLEKDEYLHSFGDYEKFYEWMIAAQETFTKEHPEIEIGPDGTIDISKLQQ